MFKGYRFILKKALPAVDLAEIEHRRTIQISEGALITVVTGPVPGGRMVECSWNGKAILMFEEDIRTHGKRVRENAAE